MKTFTRLNKEELLQEVELVKASDIKKSRKDRRINTLTKLYNQILDKEYWQNQASTPVFKEDLHNSFLNQYFNYRELEELRLKVKELESKKTDIFLNNPIQLINNMVISMKIGDKYLSINKNIFNYDH